MAIPGTESAESRASGRRCSIYRKFTGGMQGRRWPAALADEIAVLKPRGWSLPPARPCLTPSSQTEPSSRASTVDVREGIGAQDAATQLRQVDSGIRPGRPRAAVSAGAPRPSSADGLKVDLARARHHRPRADASLLITTLQHLKIIEGRENDRDGSLLDEIDPDDGRRQPPDAIVAAAPGDARADPRSTGRVEELAFLTTDRGKFRDAIKGVQDLERLLARAALGTAGPRDLVGLAHSLTVIPRVRAVLAGLRAPLAQSLLAELDDLADVRDDIERTLVDEPPALARDGGFTRDGRDPEIDELRRISRSGKQVIAEMEERERTRTGISSLKVRFNRVLDYIEISKSNLHAVPPDYLRTGDRGRWACHAALKNTKKNSRPTTDCGTRARESGRTGAIAAEPRVQASARALTTLDVLAALEVAAVATTSSPTCDGDGRPCSTARRGTARPRRRRPPGSC